MGWALGGRQPRAKNHRHGGGGRAANGRVPASADAVTDAARVGRDAVQRGDNRDSGHAASATRVCAAHQQESRGSTAPVRADCSCCLGWVGTRSAEVCNPGAGSCLLAKKATTSRSSTCTVATSGPSVTRAGAIKIFSTPRAWRVPARCAASCALPYGTPKEGAADCGALCVCELCLSPTVAVVLGKALWRADCELRRRRRCRFAVHRERLLCKRWQVRVWDCLGRGRWRSSEPCWRCVATLQHALGWMGSTAPCAGARYAALCRVVLAAWLPR